MTLIRTNHASSWRWFFVTLMLLLLSACVTVKLVADYDEQIDKGVTQLQKEVETFLVKLEGTAKNLNDMVQVYDEKHAQFYADARVAISGLRVRADATERNSLTVRMLDGLSTNLDRLERLHKEGLKKKEIESLKGAFNSQFTAILTFELAKKRGQKPDESKAKTDSTKPSNKGETK